MENKTYFEMSNLEKLNFRLEKINGIPPKYVDVTVQKDKDPEAWGKVVMICDNIGKFISEGYNVILQSTQVGNGKTTASAKMIKYAVLNNHSAYFINVHDLNQLHKKAISNNEDKEYLSNLVKKIEEYDLIVWDDIGTETYSDFDFENIYSLIENRLNNKKSNVFTTNATKEQLLEKLGARLLDRMVGLSSIIKFTGISQRQLDFFKDLKNGTKSE